MEEFSCCVFFVDVATVPFATSSATVDGLGVVVVLHVCMYRTDADDPLKLVGGIQGPSSLVVFVCGTRCGNTHHF